MNAIKERRLALGMTRPAMAQALSVSPTSIKDWERDKYRPTAENCCKMCALFQCCPEELGFSLVSLKAPSPEPSKVPPPKQPVSAEEELRRQSNREQAKEYVERRQALGLSKKELAERAGVHPNTVSTLELGKHWPCWDTRQKIRRALGMPEERYYTEEERNALFLEMQDDLKWAIRKNLSRIRAVHADPEDIWQELVIGAIRAIDRFQPNDRATVKTFARRNVDFLLERLLVRACMHGLSGKLHYPLPDIYVYSLDALMEENLQLEEKENASWDYDYAESRPQW